MLTPALQAAVPQVLNHQGRIAVDGINFDGAGQFKFALVDATGSTTFWSNDGTSNAGSQPTAAVSLSVVRGLYSVLLGDASLPNMTAVPAAVFANTNVRLRVWFNDGSHGFQLISPDQRLAASPYALAAENAALATSFSGSLAGDVSGTQSATSIAAPTVTGKLLTGYVSGAGSLLSADDTILSAFNKLDGNSKLKANLDSPTFTGMVEGTFSGPLTGNVTGNVSGSAATFTGTLAGDVTGTQSATAISAATVTGKALTGYSSASGTINATDTILTAINKLNGNDALKANLASPTFTGTVNGITASMVGLGNVSNTSDANKPVSTAQQAALDLKASLASPTFTGTVLLPTGSATSAPLKLATGVNLTTPVFGSVEFDGTNLFLTNNVGSPTRKTLAFTDAPTLTGVPLAPTAAAGTNTSQIATTQFVQSAIQGVVGAAPAALDTLNELAVALNNDASYASTITTALSLKAPLASPTFTGITTGTFSGPLTGNVTGNVSGSAATFTGTLAGDVTGTQSTTAISATTVTGKALTGYSSASGTINATDTILTAINKLNGNDALKANLASPTFTGTVGGITASMVGLGNVSNTSDANKPVSTAQQTALDLKANLASPQFTGTVSGITASMVGLGNVSNTSDANKPVSAAQQTALDLKANLASPTFTGTVLLPTGSATSAPLKLATGVNLTTPVFGSVEFDGTNLFLTNNVGSPTRKTLAFTDAPTLTGVPLAPTAAAGTNTSQIATTQFVQSAIQGVVGAAPAALDTLNELAVALNNDASYASTITTALSLKAPLASPTFTGITTGTFSGPLTGNVTGNVSGSAATFTGTLAGDVTGTQSTTAISATTVTGKALTGYSSASGTINATDTILTAINKLNGNDALKANLASPTFTGTVGGITASMVGLGNVSNTSDANKPVSTAQQTALDLKANLASPQFTGTVRLPAGSTSAAPLRFALGTNLTTAVFGSIEFDGTNLYLTNNSATPTRKTIAYTDSVIANGAVGSSQLASGLTLGGTTTGTFSGPLAGNATTATSAISFTGALGGDVTGTQSATSISAATVTGKALTGYVSGAGTISASDSILTAINKLNGNDALKANLASPTFSGTVSLPAGTGSSAPLKLAAGTSLTSASFGAVEFDGTNLYLTTNAASPTRKTLAFTDSVPTTVPAANLTAAPMVPVLAWGNNSSSQTTMPALANVAAVAAGESHSLILLDAGTVIARGLNTSGQVTVPAGLTGVTEIAAGASHNLVRKSDGTLVAWGNNSYGQATLPSGITTATRVAAGEKHSLALLANGSVRAWGDNSFGQTTLPASLTGATITAIAAGSDHSLALKSDGTVIAWGRDDAAQVTLPSGLVNVVAIAAGAFHSLALKSDGTVIAWGWDGGGQVTVPAGLSGVSKIAGGYAFSMALKTDGTLVLWGDNTDGQTTIPTSATQVTHIAAGASHALALRADAIPAQIALLDQDNVFTGKVGIKRTPAVNSLEVEGSASKTTAGSWLSNSDRRIKTEIQSITGALQKLDQVRLVDFRYTDEYRAVHPSIADVRYPNVIAQEFAEVFPDDVKNSGEVMADGSPILQVDTYPLIIYSAAAVQELNQENQKLKKQLADQEKRLRKLEALLGE
jgi:hypothetical protein